MNLCHSLFQMFLYQLIYFSALIAGLAAQHCQSYENDFDDVKQNIVVALDSLSETVGRFTKPEPDLHVTMVTRGGRHVFHLENKIPYNEALTTCWSRRTQLLEITDTNTALLAAELTQEKIWQSTIMFAGSSEKRLFPSLHTLPISLNNTELDSISIAKGKCLVFDPALFLFSSVQCASRVAEVICEKMAVNDKTLRYSKIEADKFKVNIEATKQRLEMLKINNEDIANEDRLSDCPNTTIAKLSSHLSVSKELVNTDDIPILQKLIKGFLLVSQVKKLTSHMKDNVLTSQFILKSLGYPPTAKTFWNTNNDFCVCLADGKVDSVLIQRLLELSHPKVDISGLMELAHPEVDIARLLELAHPEVNISDLIAKQPKCCNSTGCNRRAATARN